jgi:ribA/ribD-fused uncharacterized protein
MSEKKQTRTSVSRLDTFEKCARYDYFTVVSKIELPPSPYKEAGIRLHEELERPYLVPGTSPPIVGAAAKAFMFYPHPGQPGVEVERKFDGVSYAGALLYAKIDCATEPDVLSWGRLATLPKKGLPRIQDLKTTSSLRWMKSAEDLNHNRQLLAYGLIRFPEYPLIEVSQVVVERKAPFHAAQTVRIVGRDQMLSQQEQDQELIERMQSARKAESALDLEPATDHNTCLNWYGSRCAFYGRCHGSEKSSVSMSLGNILDEHFSDGRGGEGTRSALDALFEDREDAQGTVSEFRGDYGFLSNFYQSEFQYAGEVWLTAEHAYQAAKCVADFDRLRILKTTSPGQEQKIGKSVTCRGDWNDVKVSVMRDVLTSKFQNPDLRRNLLETGDSVLIEGNTWNDTFWGVCNGKGENMLGKLLMELRAKLQQDEKDDVMINPPDAAKVELNLVEGVTTIKSTVLQGQPFVSIACAERNGSPWELRLRGNALKFLTGGVATFQEGKTQITGGSVKELPLASLSFLTACPDSSYTLDKALVCGEDGRHDIDKIRKNLLNPILKAWDESLTPKQEANASSSAEPETLIDSAMDAINNAAAQTSATKSDSSTSGELEKLISSGCTPNQAEKMVAAGITDARLRAGAVSEGELLALPRFGEQRVREILSRYSAQASSTSTQSETGDKPMEKDVSDLGEKPGLVPLSDKASSAITQEQQVIRLQKASEDTKLSPEKPYVILLDCAASQGIVTDIESLDVYAGYEDSVLARQAELVVADLISGSRVIPPGVYCAESVSDAWYLVKRYMLPRASLVVRGK